MIPIRVWLFLAAIAVPTVAVGQGDVLASAPSRFATLDGSRVHYKSIGTGRTAVVLVHCWACDLNVWRTQVPVLEGRVRIIAIDLPGHGRSDKPTVAYTMAHFARATNAVLEASGVERAVVVGHSMGVPVVREFLRRYPAKVVGMVAVDGRLVSPGIDSASVERQVKLFEGPGAAAAFEQMIAPMFPAADQAALKRQVLQTARSTPQHVVQSSFRGMMDPAIWRDDPIPVPLLLIMAKGPNWPPDYRTRIQKLFPDAEYEELDGVHHFLMLERPDLFNPLLIQFLRGLGALAG
ncbi:MAG: alpha/beta fold hydrolase [Gemmatimonadales bacterium]